MTLKKPKILLVGRDDPVQETLKERLESEGFRVIQAFAWDKAIDFFMAEKVDGIVIDIEFGKKAASINGIDLIHFIKRSRNYPGPVIVYGEQTDDGPAALAAGATTFAPKSALIEEVVRALASLPEDPRIDAAAHLA